MSYLKRIIVLAVVVSSFGFSSSSKADALSRFELASQALLNAAQHDFPQGFFRKEILAHDIGPAEALNPASNVQLDGVGVGVGAQGQITWTRVKYNYNLSAGLVQRVEHIQSKSKLPAVTWGYEPAAALHPHLNLSAVLLCIQQNLPPGFPITKIDELMVFRPALVTTLGNTPRWYVDFEVGQGFNGQEFVAEIDDLSGQLIDIGPRFLAPSWP